MSRLHQRVQRHRRRQESLHMLRTAACVAAVAVLLYVFLQLPTTGAFFIDQAETEASFRATTFAGNLALTPGNSKTNDSPGDPGPAFDVAQTVTGQIYLDFGTYPVGNKRVFPHVINVQNTGGRTLSLNWRFSDNLAPFFESQDQEKIILPPGTDVKLSFNLNTNPSDQPGDYHGTLYLSALDGFITAELPARLRLEATQGKGGNSQGAAVQTKVYEDPETAVSASVYQGLGN